MANASGQRLTTELDRRPLMAGAEPIYIDQGEAGFLFLHGFTGSPYEARDLANYFSRKGYAVWAPLLPGHGTSPEDLENIAYTEWLDAAEQSYMEMKARYPKVYVCGQSMGGALALHIAANHPVNAVITFAAAIIMEDWRLALLPLAKKVLRYQHKSKGPDIRSAEAKARSASYSKYP
ncbi:MAG: alpha/beta fold hydrolase, partial [Calditrichaeota bacterium]